jgi:hypothetical protein
LPARSSSMSRSELSFRKGSTRLTMLFNDCGVSRFSSPPLCPSGPWRRRGGVPSGARCLVSRRRDLRRGDRRRATFRYAKAAYVSPWSRSPPRVRPAIRSGGRALRWLATGVLDGLSWRRPGPRYPSRVSETLRAWLEKLPKPVRDIA